MTVSLGNAVQQLLNLLLSYIFNMAHTVTQLCAVQDWSYWLLTKVTEKT